MILYPNFSFNKRKHHSYVTVAHLGSTKVVTAWILCHVMGKKKQAEEEIACLLLSSVSELGLKPYKPCRSNLSDKDLFQKIFIPSRRLEVFNPKKVAGYLRSCFPYTVYWDPELLHISCGLSSSHPQRVNCIDRSWQFSSRHTWVCSGSSPS